MSLYVPVSIDILWVVGFVAGDFDLFKAPLWQIDISSSEVASQDSMLQSERSRQSSDFGSVARRHILDNLHGPVILLVPNSSVSVA